MAQLFPLFSSKIPNVFRDFLRERDAIICFKRTHVLDRLHELASSRKLDDEWPRRSFVSSCDFPVIVTTVSNR